MIPSNRCLRTIISTVLLCTILLQYCDGRSRHRTSSPRRQSKYQLESRRERKPNIILIMSDDQDVLLGSMGAMNKTRRLLGDKGANFINAFVTTPLCCPSRSSILTGQYVHNHGVYSNQDHCVSDEWKAGPERRSFGAFLQNANYRTGYFGKYLNRYDGTYVPNGWVEWVGLLQNSKFYNYTLNRNGQLFNHGHDYHRDYLPDLIANDSVTFFKLSKMAYPDNPIHMVLSMPGPHGPEDGAPQFAQMFQNNQWHRTETWNYNPNFDKHWIMQYTPPLTDQLKTFTDFLQRKRLITLQSIDDAVAKVCNTLEELGELDNTYIIYTSDHGYHLGQYGMVKGKSNPYDFDVRVPFYIRGPKIPAGVDVPNIVLNIDLAPTILNLAGIPIPPYMDGTSIVKLFDPPSNYKVTKRRKFRYVGREPWRDSFMIERTRSPEEWEQYFRKRQKELERGKKPPKTDEECSLPEMQLPCKPGQTKYCVEDEGMIKIRKCRVAAAETKEPKCRCTKIRNTNPKNDNNNNKGKRGSSMTKAEKRQQRVFLRDHVNQGDNYRPGRFLRGRRDVAQQDIDDLSDFAGSYDLQFEISQLSAIIGDTKCRVLTNDTVVCDEEVFESKKSLVEHKKRIDEQLQLLREQMKNLQEIKLYLKRVQPDKDDKEKITKETHICRCEGGLAVTADRDLLADEPDNTDVDVVYEEDIDGEEEEEQQRRKSDKKKKDRTERRRNRQKRKATFEDNFANEAEPFFEDADSNDFEDIDIGNTKETQTLTLLERRRIRKQEKKKSKHKKIALWKE
ncbi:extracellular sulfatase Sulf-1-like isoform X2 [Amphiura filiformis]|uniref:extracellular sulfatase Sulf-1-like isoform X2 n=1 Tax=Amphiura filiformis TaxID=82378 RepID=UPI003B21F994